MIWAFRGALSAAVATNLVLGGIPTAETKLLRQKPYLGAWLFVVFIVGRIDYVSGILLAVLTITLQMS